MSKIKRFLQKQPEVNFHKKKTTQFHFMDDFKPFFIDFLKKLKFYNSNKT